MPTQARFPGRGGKGYTSNYRKAPAHDKDFALKGRTLFLNRVRPPNLAEDVLKSGVNNGKIGKTVTKGNLKGAPIFTLTLEERATCPRSCEHWRTCYGNGMQWPTRWVAGEELERQLDFELHKKAREFPDGFLVRLHVLGDFYSVGYCDRWAHWLRNIPQVNVYGFSARKDVGDPIAFALLTMISEFGFRFAIRFSNSSAPVWSTETIEMPDHKSPESFICPQQMGTVETCGDCGACWGTKKKIAFLRH